MKRRLRAFLAASILLAAPTAAAAGDLTLQVSNLKDAPLVAFRVTRAGGGGPWGHNLLAGAWVPPGGLVDVDITRGRDVCRYDVRAEFENGETVEDRGLDLCAVDAYTVY